ncbi:MAG: GDP-mannose 4,6-dehydratase [Chloroflexi bacterium]|nr:GDP-mannose 4,6-dehydratase [Chloroflexota bacterium]
MRVLITGVTGMAGSHLAEFALRETSAEVYGTYRWRSRLDNLVDLDRQGRVNFVAYGGNVHDPASLAAYIAREAKPRALNLLPADLADPVSVRTLISAVQPDRIFHLAAQSFVPTSWHAPADTLQLNIIGQLHLFEAIRAAGIDPLIHVAGSSEEYGLVYEHEAPIKESNPLRPLSPYAVSKVGQEMLAWQYHRSYGLQTVVTRGFNHTGPRRGEVFVTSSFAKQIAEIERGIRPPVVQVGDLSPRRDWSDVRDIVRGYWMALEYGVPGSVYNIGSGIARSIEEMLHVLLKQSRADVQVVVDPSRLRPSDVLLLWADTSAFRRQTGWEPRIPFEQTMGSLLDYWRERVGQFGEVRLQGQAR